MQSLEPRAAARRLTRTPAFSVPAAVSIAAGALVGLLATLLARANAAPPHIVSRLGVDPVPPADWGSHWTAAATTPAAQQASHLNALTLTLLATAALVVGIAMLNLLVLMGGRASSRRREMAVRFALGPSRLRLLAPLVMEGVLLAGLGAALAAAGASLALPALLHSMPAGLHEALPLDRWLALGLVGAPLLLTGMLAMLPVADVLTLPMAPQLAAGGRATAGRGTGLMRDALVIAQLTGAVVLLFGAGLLLRRTNTTRDTSGVVDPGHVVVATVVPGVSGLAARRAGAERLLSRVRAAPGVESVGLGSMGAVLGVGTQDAVITDCQCSRGGLAAPLVSAEVEIHAVTRGFFDTLGVQSLEGGAAPVTHSPDGPTVVVNRALLESRILGPHELTKHVQLGGALGPWYRVRGVVENLEAAGIGNAPGVTPALYVSALQDPPRTLRVVVRTTDPADAARPAVEAVLRASSPGARVEAEPLATLLDRFVAPLRWFGWLTVVLGLAAGFLAGYGVFSVSGYTVALRRRELGIRMALGARGRRVAWLVIGRMLRLALIGGGAGLVVTVSVMRGVSIADPTLLAAIAGTLVVTATAGAALPAWRATRVDPAAVLRE
ncbi:MAG: ABC transporter permease [Gemmatimonadota bacterium]